MPNPLDKGLFTIMQNLFFVAFTNSEKKERDLLGIFWQKMSRRSHVFFSEFVIATKKWFCMMVNNPLSRGLGNIAKLYLITCRQCARSKLKKHEFAKTLTSNSPYIYIHILKSVLGNGNFKVIYLSL